MRRQLLFHVSSVTLRQDANLRMSVRNPLNPDEVRENIVIDPSETIELEEDSREPPHHFHLKWEGSKKASILHVHAGADKAASVLKGSSKKKKYKGDMPRSYTEDDSGNWVPLLLLECRGMEPYAFHPMKDEFVISSTDDGCVFNEEIELDDDWADYDAENDVSVSLSEIQFEFKAV